MIVGLSIGATVLRTILIFLGRTVGRIVVFGSGARVKAAALRVDTSVATLCAREKDRESGLAIFNYISPPKHDLTY